MNENVIGKVPVPILYGWVRFVEGFQAGIMVGGKVILELKSVEQIFTYLKLKGLNLGYLLNFGANLMKDGVERIVIGFSEENLGVFASLREGQTK